jgi:4-amino-4-deoxy-L-arabinose transferase-like glycosyltransferase
MSHAYVRDALGSHPIRFAEDFYAHYPKVAIGHWPPLFYAVQAGWMFALPPSRLSAMLLIACIHAAIMMICAWMVYVARFSMWAGAAVPALYLSIPICRLDVAMFMADSLVCLWVLLAALCCASYLHRGRGRSVIGFAIFSTLAILTKGNGFVLVLVPLFLMVWTRRVKWALHPRFFAGAVGCAVLTVPWTLTTSRMLTNGTLEDGIAISSLPFSLPFFLNPINYGIVLGCLAVVGIVHAALARETLPGPPEVWDAAAALFVAVPIFHALALVSYETRFLLVSVPGALLLALNGASVPAHK